MSYTLYIPPILLVDHTSCMMDSSSILNCPSRLYYSSEEKFNFHSFDLNKVLEFGALVASGGQVLSFHLYPQGPKSKRIYFFAEYLSLLIHIWTSICSMSINRYILFINSLQLILCLLSDSWNNWISVLLFFVSAELLSSYGSADMITIALLFGWGGANLNPQEKLVNISLN